MDGFVVINKPSGVTSFSVTGAVKRKTGVRRCGHAGTLDPLASGVLPVMVGRATRLIDLIDDNQKVYRAGVVFGLTTDTLDCEGKVLTDQPTENLTREKIEDALENFKGEIEQIPPMYSAVKKDGVKLYDLARKGIEVERKPRTVTVFDIKLLEFDGEDFAELLITCSKGTYVRTIIDDLGVALGCGAFMCSLVREKGSSFTLSDAIDLDEFLQKDLSETLLPPDRAVDFPKVFVTENQATRFSNGGELDFTRVNLPEDSVYYRVYCGDKFLGVGVKKETALFPKCVF